MRNRIQIKLKGKIKNEQLIYGRNPITEALDESRHFDRIFIRDNLRGDFEKEIRQACRERDIPLKRVPLIKLDKLSRNKNHQGVVGIVSPLRYADLDDIIPFVYEQGESPFILVLDNIQDIRNVGAISRSAEAFGVHALVISGKNAGSINADAIKASAGTLLRIPVCRHSSTSDLFIVLRAHGIKVIGTTTSGDDFINKAELTLPLALVMGSEGQGLDRELEKICDKTVAIPMKRNTESLNVSVAAGIILYEIQRRYWS